LDILWIYVYADRAWALDLKIRSEYLLGEESEYPLVMVGRRLFTIYQILNMTTNGEHVQTGDNKKGDLRLVLCYYSIGHIMGNGVEKFEL
jgi:hypothetical protein